MNYLKDIVGRQMNVKENYTKKALKSILVAAILTLGCLLGYQGLSVSLAQETSTLTPVQTETTMTAQEDQDVSTLAPQSPGVVATTVITTPDVTAVEGNDTPESRVCDALASQIISNLAQYPDWQISLNDSNGNVQGLGTMTKSGLELELFNAEAKELYLYYFTDEKAITIANSSGLRISLIQRDSAQGASSTYATDSNGRGIIINATIDEDREARPINECILPFEQVFPNYTIKGN